METREFIIPLDAKKKHFYDILSYSNRVMLSARYGDGKTFFLENFFSEYKDEFYCIKIYPINYQVEENKDIFEYIKKDILIQLFSNNNIIEEIEIDRYFFIQYYLFNHGSDIILDLLNSIPTTSLPINLIQNVIKQIQKFKQIQKNTTSSFNDKIESYLHDFSNKKGICEFDCISELITKCINKIKTTGKKVIFIIEDLDRIDPAHIFRILNILSAHIDRINVLPYEDEYNQQKNKFNFDVIISVCDYQNIKNIFHHFYGYKTDFEGYINKFISNEPFNYSIQEVVKNYINERLSNIFDLPSYVNKPIKFLEEELGKKSIRECINTLNNLDKEIRISYLFFEKYRISTLNSASLLFVLLKRLGKYLDGNFEELPDLTLDEIYSLTNIIGVNWLITHGTDLATIVLPIKSKFGMKNLYELPVCAQINKNMTIIKLKLENNYLDIDSLIEGLDKTYKLLKPYIKL